VGKIDAIFTSQAGDGQNATGEPIALLQACAEYTSNKSLKEEYTKLRENYCGFPPVDDILIRKWLALYSFFDH